MERADRKEIKRQVHAGLFIQRVAQFLNARKSGLFFKIEKKAFERLVNKEKFQKWLKQEIKIRTGERALMEAQVDAAMKPENLRIEHQNTDGTWSFLQ